MSPTKPPGGVLQLFLPVVAEWFREHLGQPSPIQERGWPIIASGRHTLLIAPTGSGKTLAAFLVALDRLWRTANETDAVRILYLSPLRALNYDISRNLQLPLQGVQHLAAERGLQLPPLRLAVRTGDTPSRERARLLRKPPHILITTPESLHLLLTSRARDILRSVEACIVDEWHALFPNKRGVFTCLLLERLACLNCREFQRIGLSATLRPAQTAAQMLAGVGREVAIVDLGETRPLDVAVLFPAFDSDEAGERSVWPSLESATLQLIREHNSTLVFTNNRRAAERLSARLRENWAVLEDGEDSGASPRVRAHHGSLSLQVRRQTEQALKEGRVRGVVATASLELGIDIGSVDLVCQIESPGSLYRAWQRLGRSGHRVGAVCKGRFLAKTVADLVELAALVRAMRQGVLETFQAPENCLDVLAQQIVAMVAMDIWRVDDLEKVVRRAWPYRQLPPSALENVLAMLSGRWPLSQSALVRPRMSWDKATNQLYPMPGSQHVALVNGGTIPDTGQYKVVLADNGVVLGTLDEEFVYERRLGDVFVLGMGVWCIEDITAQEVIVTRAAPGMPAVTPFWRGERLGRSWELGLAVGELLRELGQRLEEPDGCDWLRRECQLEERAAQQLLEYLRRQRDQAGAIPSDRTIVVEAFRDEMADWYLAILTPFGQRWHLTLRLALEAWWKERYGFTPPAVHHDDGVLIRLLDAGTAPLDVLDHLDPDRLESDVLAALGDCAYFAVRFRHNAMRALLLPRQHPHQRTPLWLQRLKARNWLQLVRECPDFPIVVETYRECLQEHLDIPRVRQVLESLRRGEIVEHRILREYPSPFAAQLRFQFTGAFMYDYDRVEVPNRGLAVSIEGLRELLGAPAVTPLDKALLEETQRSADLPIRSEHELAEWLRYRGDTLPEELPRGQEECLRRLVEQRRVVWWQIPGQVRQSGRWIVAEDIPLYACAFGIVGESAENAARACSLEQQRAWQEILRRYLMHHASATVRDLVDRYPIPRSWVEATLRAAVEQGWLCALPEPDGQVRYVRQELVERVRYRQRRQQRAALREVPLRQYGLFLLHWHGLASHSTPGGLDGLRQALRRLQAHWLPACCWESLLLRPRLTDYHPSWLDSLVQTGEWIWLLRGPAIADAAEGDTFSVEDGFLAFLPRADADYAALLPGRQHSALSQLAEQLLQMLGQRGASFVVDLARVTGWSPSRVRRALRELAAAGLVSNDHFDVVRKWDSVMDVSNSLGRGRWRRPVIGGPIGEGRWFALPQQTPAAEPAVLWYVHVLLERYGIVCRELAEQDGCALSWSVLRTALEQLEWAGEVRRGYFVAGWSGEQFGLPEAVSLLYSVTEANTLPLAVTGIDPAALFGLGTETDTGLFGGEYRTSRRLSNAVVWLKNQPVLLLEGFGQKVAALPQATPEECQQAVGALKDLARHWQPWLRGRLRVHTWNGQPVLQSSAAAWLAEIGFVRDYEGMVLYLGCE